MVFSRHPIQGQVRRKDPAMNSQKRIIENRVGILFSENEQIAGAIKPGLPVAHPLVFKNILQFDQF
jgi:hypothetical protein